MSFAKQINRSVEIEIEIEAINSNKVKKSDETIDNLDIMPSDKTQEGIDRIEYRQFIVFVVVVELVSEKMC